MGLLDKRSVNFYRNILELRVVDKVKRQFRYLVVSDRSTSDLDSPKTCGLL